MKHRKEDSTAVYGHFRQFKEVCGLLKVWTQTFGGPLGAMDNDLLLLGDGVTMLPQMATQHPYTFPMMCVYFYFPPALQRVNPSAGRASGHPFKTKLLHKALQRLKKRKKVLLRLDTRERSIYIHTYLKYVHIYEMCTSENPSSLTVQILFCFHEWKCISGEFCKYILSWFIFVFLFLNK